MIVTVVCGKCVPPLERVLYTGTCPQCNGAGVVQAMAPDQAPIDLQISTSTMEISDDLATRLMPGGVGEQELIDAITSDIKAGGPLAAMFCEHANEGPRGACTCHANCYCRRSGGMCPTHVGGTYRPTVIAPVVDDELATLAYDAYCKAEDYPANGPPFNTCSEQYKQRWRAVAKAFEEHYAKLQREG